MQSAFFIVDASVFVVFLYFLQLKALTLQVFFFRLTAFQMFSVYGFSVYIPWFPSLLGQKLIVFFFKFKSDSLLTKLL